MRISDWSADVCSSDLGLALEDLPGPFRRGRGSDGRDTGTVVSPARDRQAVSGDGPDGPAAAAAPPRALSEVIADLAAMPDDMVSLGAIASSLSDRSYGALLILFSGPNLLPLPPGASTLFGIPLIVIAAPLLIGFPQVWLPRQLRERTIDRDTLQRVCTRLGPNRKSTRLNPSH